VAYDVGKLREQKKRIEDGIIEIQKALMTEQMKLARTEMMIEEAEKVMDSHDFQACKRGVADHDWRIVSRHADGPLRNKWKQRYCAKCKESQSSGHGVTPAPVPMD
jgi:RNase P subunit RPR2